MHNTIILFYFINIINEDYVGFSQHLPAEINHHILFYSHFLSEFDKIQHLQSNAFAKKKKTHNINFV